MTTTVEAISEQGKLVLPCPLSLADKARVRVTSVTDPEREACLKQFEESLTQTWDNEPDGIFNELLQK